MDTDRTSPAWSGAVSVHPWIGKHYHRPSRLPHRTLILGESNYTEPEFFTPSLVQNCVLNDLGTESRDTSGFCRFSTKLRRLIFGPDESVGPDFWHDVAFYNFVQQRVGSAARVRPGPAMWRESLTAFGEIIELVQPDRLLVLGAANWSNLHRHVPSSDRDGHRANLHVGRQVIASGYANHPSSSLRYTTWVPRTRTLLGLPEFAGNTA